jgi:trehalose 6-phosphate phosphatase
MTATRELDPTLRAALESFVARRPVLVALDFDGVLAPLVDDPDTSRPLDVSSAALGRIAGAPGVRLALVSGRAMSDLRRLSGAPEGTVLVASHGAEVEGVPTALDEPTAELLARVRDELQALSDEHPGTHVEAKPAGAVLHTRRAAPDVAHHAVTEALSGPARREGVRLMRGKDVVELSVVDADKGRAVSDLRQRLGVSAVLYAGDDVTDEHALATLMPQAGDVGVKVGPGESVAAHRVASPDDVAVLLTTLADLLGR